MLKKNLKMAIPYTIPVMLGYLSVGMAFGVLVVKAGISIWLGVLMSLFVYAGAMQFVAIQILTSPIHLIQVIFMTLFVNIRHLFYGLSFIERFKRFGVKKQYMIFGLTDETYSLLCGITDKSEDELEDLYFIITLLNQSYWVIGTLIGGLLGSVITFDTTGIDFAMTALFVVIFIEQWLAADKHLPALIGLAAAMISLKFFGPEQMVLPSMLLLFSALLFLNAKVKGGESNG